MKIPVFLFVNLIGHSLGILFLLFTSGTAWGDIVVTERFSQGEFDVVAANVSDIDRHRVVDNLTDLGGAFVMSESYNANVLNGEAAGTYSHFDSISNTGTQLTIVANSSMAGNATQSGTAFSSSTISEFLFFDFVVVDGPANFTLTGNFAPTDSIDDQMFLRNTLAGVDTFRISTAQAFDLSGTLVEGNYTFRVINGTATSNNGSPFAGGHAVSLTVTSVPEPSSLVGLGLFSLFVGRRCRNFR